MSRKAAILGLGRRGADWARLLHRAGWQVAGFDPDPLAKGLPASARDCRREETISATVRGADWIICCLPDRLELTQMVLKRAQAEAEEDAVVAVHSIRHDVHEVQACAMRAAAVVQVSDRPGGGFTLDVSTKNSDHAKSFAREVLAEVAALSTLDPGKPQRAQKAAQPPDSESA